jgi:hypothetical protein
MVGAQVAQWICAESHHEVLLESHQHVRKAGAQDVLGPFAERIRDDRHRHEMVRELRQVLIEARPIGTREDRIGPHRVAVPLVPDLAFDQRAPRARKSTEHSSVGDGGGVRGMGIPAQQGVHGASVSSSRRRSLDRSALIACAAWPGVESLAR